MNGKADMKIVTMQLIPCKQNVRCNAVVWQEISYTNTHTKIVDCVNKHFSGWQWCNSDSAASQAASNSSSNKHLVPPRLLHIQCSNPTTLFFPFKIDHFYTYSGGHTYWYKKQPFFPAWQTFIPLWEAWQPQQVVRCVWVSHYVLLDLCGSSFRLGLKS